MQRTLRLALPSAVTLGGVFFGLLSMVLAAEEPYRACLALIGAGLCDMVDGRVARMVDARSEFGAELDSLADVISFGLAPAWLAWSWSLGQWGLPALGIAFCFTACAALRLARFNTMGDSIPSDVFLGIPTPAAALLVVTLVMTAHELDVEALRGAPVVATTVLVAAFAMVSPARYPSYKTFKTRSGKVLFFASIAGGLTMLILGLPGGTVLFALVSVYTLGGGVLSLIRRAQSSEFGSQP